MVGESTAGGGSGAGAGRRRTSYASRVFLGLSAVVGVQSTGNHRVGVGRRRVTLACVPGGRGRVRRLLAAATRAPAPSLYHHMGICFFSIDPPHGHLHLLYTPTLAFASSLYPTRAPAPSLDPYRGTCFFSIPHTGICFFNPLHGHVLLLYTPTRAFASLNPYTGICCFSVPLQRHLLLLYTATRAPAPRLPRPAAARALVLAMTHRRQHRTGARAGTPSSASPATCSPTATRASTRSSTTTVLPPGESL